MAKSLFVDWGMQHGMHNAGVKTPYEMLTRFLRSRKALLDYLR
jgi:hypothetical protein